LISEYWWKRTLQLTWISHAADRYSYNGRLYLFTIQLDFYFSVSALVYMCVVWKKYVFVCSVWWIRWELLVSSDPHLGTTVAGTATSIVYVQVNILKCVCVRACNGIVEIHCVNFDNRHFRFHYLTDTNRQCVWYLIIIFTDQRACKGSSHQHKRYDSWYYWHMRYTDSLVCQWLYNYYLLIHTITYTCVTYCNPNKPTLILLLIELHSYPHMVY